jgi:hemerythrin-like domain-containing protein
MPDALLLLRLEHVNTARLLTVLEDQGARLSADVEVDADVLRLVLEYFQGFPDQCHHPKEDLVFRKLHRRDPAASEAVGDLLAEHVEIARTTERLALAVDRWSARSNGGSAELVPALREFIDGYRRHLQDEEARFFPAALSTLTPDDWAEIDFGVFDRKDPLFDDVVEDRFQDLRDRIRMLTEQDLTG